MKRQHRDTTTAVSGDLIDPRKFITCKNPDCDQIIATRSGWGKDPSPYHDRMKDVVLQLFGHADRSWTIDSDGRLVIRCKQCGTRNRLLSTTRLKKERA